MFGPSVCLSPLLKGKGHHRENMHSRYTWHKGRVVMLSPAQWCSSVQLLQLASLYLVHGIYTSTT